MFTLADLTRNNTPEFTSYVRQKTGFLLSNPNEQVQFLWKHILDTNSFQTHWDNLDQEQKGLFFLFFYNYGYLPYYEQAFALENLEKKIPYLFRHPMGGFFIPVEFFKLFMKQNFLQKNFFSFSLLYQMNLSVKETKNFLSLIGKDFAVPPHIEEEKSPADKALLLYIFLSGRHRKLQEKDISQMQKKFFANRTSFKDNTITYLPSFSKAKANKLYPKEPVNLWKYLEEHFQEEKENVEQLYFLLHDAKKEFYRSIALLSQSKIGEMFSWGYLFPVFSNKNIDDIRVVCPQETRFHFSMAL